ncbi:MAG: hypothetical protein J7M10_06015, partial [Candidatus Cloacimonetes bacterium]|nr:hypothetical protein [Candidatus Cloacimonadota bacterium]
RKYFPTEFIIHLRFSDHFVTHKVKIHYNFPPLFSPIPSNTLTENNAVRFFGQYKLLTENMNHERHH